MKKKKSEEESEETTHHRVAATLLQALHDLERQLRLHAACAVVPNAKQGRQKYQKSEGIRCPQIAVVWDNSSAPCIVIWWH
eukprot:SAG31_NODE_21043_length_559_cov_0.797826_2_plen_81_part_00